MKDESIYKKKDRTTQKSQDIEYTNTNIPTRSASLISAKNALTGFFISVISSLLNVLANILLKKVTFFNGFDNSAILFLLQLTVLFIIAKVNQLNVFGDKENYKILFFRGFMGGIGLIAYYVSVKLIDPSDAISLISSNVIFVAIIGRIYMKEKFTIIHIIALIFILLGIVCITQPASLIPKKQTGQDLNRSGNISLIQTSSHESYNIKTILGICIALGGSFMIAMNIVLMKELSERKIHFSVINLYASYFGLPLSIMCIVIAIFTGYDTKHSPLIDQYQILWEIFYSVISALSGIFSQVFLITALKFDDCTKISMYRTLDLLFTFLFQYFWLNISSNLFSIVGSACIGIGMVLIMGYKFIENNKKTEIHSKDIDNGNNEPLKN